MPISDRLATLRLPVQRVYLVLGYAPTSAAPDADYDDFVELVEGALRRTPNGYTPVLMGDFNCKVSRSVGNERIVGEYGSPTSNARGDTFVDLCTRFDLRIWNTFFKCRQGRRWTWRSPNGHTFLQIDFMAAPISAPVHKCGVLNRFEFDTDHRLLRMLLRVRECKTRFRVKRPRQTLDAQAYKTDSNLLATVNLPQPRSAIEAYHSIVVFTETAAANSWRDVTTSPWLSMRTRTLLAQRHSLRNDPTRAVAYSIACKTARASLLCDIRRRKDAQAQRAATMGRSILREARSSYTFRPRISIPDRTTGEISQEATKRAVETFYSSLYQPNVNLPLAIPPADGADWHVFMASEALSAMSDLKCGHAAGVDRVLPDMLYHSRHHLAQILADLVNMICEGDEIPETMVKAIVTLLHKSGATTDISNFRPISLLTVTMKAATKMLLNRMDKALNEFEDVTQTGFRRGYGTQDNIHVMRQLAEKCNEFRMPLYIGFVDFRKAFDLVEWSAVWEALHTHGVSTTLIHALRRIYETSKTLIAVNEDKVEVPVRRGVRQGDTLSPRLFNAVLRHAMDTIDWEDCGHVIDGVPLSHLEYADDIALIAKSRPEMISMLTKLNEACVRVGLEINSRKTCLLSNCTSTKQPITIENMTFAFVESTTYLGSHFSLPLSPRETVNHRLRCAWMAWSKIRHVLTSRVLPFNTRRRVFESCVSSTLLYGGESWALRQSDKECLRVAQHKMERRILGLTLLDRWRNDQIRDTTKLRDWVDEAGNRKKKYMIRLRLMAENRWARRITTWTPYNYSHRRLPGAPATRWRRDLREELGPNWWNTPNI